MPSTTLTGALAANAGFSAATALIMIGAAAPLAHRLGIPVWLTFTTGVGLLSFAVAVAVIARNPKRQTVRNVIAADVAWIVGAVVVLLGFPDAMTTAGRWMLGLVTVVVVDLAALQAVGLRRTEIPGRGSMIGRT